MSIMFSNISIVRTWDASVPAHEVVQNVLSALQHNDHPTANAGMRTFWDWTHELYRGRPVNGHGNFSIFEERAARSELGAIIGCHSFKLEPHNPVGDGSKYGTQVAVVRPREGDDGRRYLFQLRRELRPPYSGSWSIWGVIVSDQAGSIQDLSGGF